MRDVTVGDAVCMMRDGGDAVCRMRDAVCRMRDVVSDLQGHRTGDSCSEMRAVFRHCTLCAKSWATFLLPHSNGTGGD